MRHFLVSFVLGGLLLTTGCQPAYDAGSVPYSTPVAPVGTEHAGGPTAAATEPWKEADSMPIFVEVTQRTMMGRPPAQQTPLQVGAAAFRFSADAGLLLVQPSVLGESFAADVLVGESTILLTAGQSYENRELVQFPAEQPALFHILGFDADTGTVRLAYEGETHELARGGSLEFEQDDGGAGTPVVSTIIVNHGRLSAIQLATPDGSIR